MDWHPIQGEVEILLVTCYRNWKLAWWAAWHMHMHADFTSTSELPFASLERVLVLSSSFKFQVFYCFTLFLEKLINILYKKCRNQRSFT